MFRQQRAQLLKCEGFRHQRNVQSLVQESLQEVICPKGLRVHIFITNTGYFTFLFARI